MHGLYIYIYIYDIGVHVCTYVCICIYMYNIYIYIYVFIFIFMNLYTKHRHTHTHTKKQAHQHGGVFHATSGIENTDVVVGHGAYDGGDGDNDDAGGGASGYVDEHEGKMRLLVPTYPGTRKGIHETEQHFSILLQYFARPRKAKMTSNTEPKLMVPSFNSLHLTQSATAPPSSQRVLRLHSGMTALSCLQKVTKREYRHPDCRHYSGYCSNYEWCLER